MIPFDALEVVEYFGREWSVSCIDFCKRMVGFLVGICDRVQVFEELLILIGVRSFGPGYTMIKQVFRMEDCSGKE